MFNRFEKLLLFCLASISFNHTVDFMILMPLGPQLMREFVITPSQFSFLVGCYSFFAGLSGFLASFYADLFDLRIQSRCLLQHFVKPEAHTTKTKQSYI